MIGKYFVIHLSNRFLIKLEAKTENNCELWPETRREATQRAERRIRVIEIAFCVWI